MPIFKLNDIKSGGKNEVEGDDVDGKNEVEGDDVDGKEKGEVDKSVKLVKLEGSLSSIYTEALLKEYSLEGLSASGMVDNDYDDVKVDKSYLYATSGDDLSIADANMIIKDISATLDEDYDKRTISISKVKRTTPALQLVDDYARDIGFDVVYGDRKMSTMI